MICEGKKKAKLTGKMGKKTIVKIQFVKKKERKKDKQRHVTFWMIGILRI